MPVAALEYDVPVAKSLRFTVHTGLADLVVWEALLCEALFLVEVAGPLLLEPSVGMLNFGYTDEVPVLTLPLSIG